jgi:hypothetical protein
MHGGVTGKASDGLPMSIKASLYPRLYASHPLRGFGPSIIRLCGGSYYLSGQTIGTNQITMAKTTTVRIDPTLRKSKNR